MAEQTQTETRSYPPGGTDSIFALSDKIVTGVDAVQVYLEEKRVNSDKTILRSYTVTRGQALPKNLIPGEVERLEAMGAFESKTPRMRRIEARRQRKRLNEQLAAPVSLPTPGDPTLAPMGTESVRATENRPETPWMGAPPGGVQTATVSGVAAASVVDADLQARAQQPPPDGDGGAATATADTGDEYAGKSGKELKDIAESKGVAKSGSKAQIIARLRKADAEHQH